MGKYRTSGYSVRIVECGDSIGGFLLPGLLLLLLVPSFVLSFSIGSVLEEAKLDGGVSIPGENVDLLLVKAGANCTPSSLQDFPPDLFTKEERLQGAVVLHFIGSLYVFYALFIVCDDYFVPSIEAITRDFRIPSELAGATIMAVSTSAPELFTNVMATFVTKGDMGIGTIVGSAVFNILAVGTCCGLGAGFSLKKGRRPGIPIDPWSLSRDSFFYTCSVLLLLLVLFNRRIYWYEALTLLLFYLVYILVLCNNNLFKGWAEKLLNISSKSEKAAAKGETALQWENFWAEKGEKSPLLIEKIENDYAAIKEGGTPFSSVETSPETSTEVTSTEEEEEVRLQKLLIRAESRTEEEYKERGFWGFPAEGGGCGEWIVWFVALPIRLLFKMTIPDCRRPRWRRWYFLSLAHCVIYIGGLTYLVTWMMEVIGDTLSIPESVTGLTFLAAGTSIPEVISSVIVARQGFGSMGLSNSIGSNTFDLLFCLGIPWLIQSLLLAGTETPYVEIHSGGLELSVALLIMSLLLFYVAVALNGFKLDWKLGVFCLLMYALFLPIAILLELNFFFPVNLPPCSS